MRTSHELVKMCLSDEPLQNLAVMCDYFNSFKYGNNDEILTIIYGVYQKLIKLDLINEKTLHNALLNDTLDEMIHKIYQDKKLYTYYYKYFCDNKIILSNKL